MRRRFWLKEVPRIIWDGLGHFAWLFVGCLVFALSGFALDIRDERIIYFLLPLLLPLGCWVGYVIGGISGYREGMREYLERQQQKRDQEE